MTVYTDWLEKIEIARSEREYQIYHSTEYARGFSFRSELDWDAEEAINPSCRNDTAKIRYQFDGVVAAMNKSCDDCEERAAAWVHWEDNCPCCSYEYFFCADHLLEWWDY